MKAVKSKTRNQVSEYEAMGNSYIKNIVSLFSNISGRGLWICKMDNC